MSHSSEKLNFLQRLQPTPRGVIALLLILAVPLVADLQLLNARTSMLQAGDLLTINGWVPVDAEFELRRVAKAIDACPDDAKL